MLRVSRPGTTRSYLPEWWSPWAVVGTVFMLDPESSLEMFQWRILYSRWVRYWERFEDIFTQGRLDTGEVSEMYLLRVVCILGNIWRYIFYLLRVGWNWIGDIFSLSGLDTREGLEIYLNIYSGWAGKIWRFINSMWVGFNGKFEYQFNLREPLLKQP